MTDRDVTDDLELALRLADAADAISLARFGALDLRVDTKPDLTPVSDADVAVERAIRQLLVAERPEQQIVGEEFGGRDALTSISDAKGLVWVVDPIDGTKNYVRGVPVWGTLIAALRSGQPVIGVVSAPALARRWWAAEGSGAWTRFTDGQPRPITVSAVSTLENASLSYSDLSEWSLAGRGVQINALMDACWRTRAYGDFWSYMLVAEGAVDIAAEPDLQLWDLAALAPIVIEAGGTFTDMAGETVGWSTTSALASNVLLHQAVLDRLAG